MGSTEQDDQSGLELVELGAKGSSSPLGLAVERCLGEPKGLLLVAGSFPVPLRPRRLGHVGTPVPLDTCLVSLDSRHVTSTVAGMAHHLVGAAEIADMLGVSRQRVWQLAGEPGFPAPEVELASGRVWKRSAIEKWARDTGREVTT